MLLHDAEVSDVGVAVAAAGREVRVGAIGGVVGGELGLGKVERNVGRCGCGIACRLYIIMALHVCVVVVG